MLKAARRLSKQPNMLQRKELLQKAPQLQSTSKERALKCCSNKGSSNGRDMFILSHTCSGAVCRLLSGHLPKELTSAASSMPAPPAQELRGDKGVPVGPHDSWRAGSDNKAHICAVLAGSTTAETPIPAIPRISIWAQSLQSASQLTKDPKMPPNHTTSYTQGQMSSGHLPPLWAGGHPHTGGSSHHSNPLPQQTLSPVPLQGTPQASQDQFGLRDRMRAGTSPLPPAHGAAG